MFAIVVGIAVSSSYLFGILGARRFYMFLLS